MKCFQRAGLRTVAAFLLAGQALAQDLLSTSGFSNCATNASIKVNYAYVSFDRSTGSVNFNVSGTSNAVQKVKASLTVTAYGVQVYQNNFDPCAASTKVDQLCPVPSGTFSANGTQKISSQHLSQVPSIAYSLPDLDGNVTMKLLSANGQAEVGCVQSGISNGKTLQIPAVANAAMGVAAAALVLSGVSSLMSAGTAGTAASSIGFATVLGWFQTISVTGMMSVNYPPVYRSFSKNFAFSTGLISSPAIQSRIDAFRNQTGGNLTNDNTAFLQNLNLAVANGSSAAMQLSPRGYIETALRTVLHARDVSLGRRANTTDASTGSGGNTTFSNDMHGIGAFASELLIPQANVFMTALLVFAIIAGSITLGILLLKLILELWAAFGTLPQKLRSFRRRYWTLLAKTLANLILLIYGIWVAWCIFQFTVGDSLAARVLAAVSLAVFTAVLAGFALRIVVVARRYRQAEGDASALYDNKETWLTYGVFYDSYKKSHWWMFMPFIGFAFARGAILAGGNGHGLVQTVAQLCVEGVAMVFLAWCRPFATPAGNWINLGIQLVRVLSFVCVLVFVEELNVPQTTQTVTGFALVVVQAVLTAVLALLIAVNAIVVFCRENPHRKRRKEKEKMREARDTLTSLDTRNSFLAREAEMRNSTVQVGRPRITRQGTSFEALTANPAAFASAGHRPQRSVHSYEDLAYRQPAVPMI